jgi:hypothetical protein
MSALPPKPDSCSAARSILTRSTHPNALDRNCIYFDQAEQSERPSQKSDRDAIPPTNSTNMIRKAKAKPGSTLFALIGEEQIPTS